MKKGFLKYVKIFKFKSVFISNLIKVLLMVLLPSFLLMLLFCINVQKNSNEFFTFQIQSSLDVASDTVDRILNDSKRIVNQTTIDDTVTSLLMSVYSEEYDYNLIQKKREVKDYIQRHINAYRYIHSMIVYSENLDVVITNQKDSNLFDNLDNSWVQMYSSMGNSETRIFSRKWKNLYPDFISIIRTVGYTDGTKAGCVVINIDAEELNDILKKISSGNGNQIVVVDQNRNICLSPVNEWFLENIDNHMIFTDSDITENTVKPTKVSVDDEPFRYISKPLDDLPLYCAMVVPEAAFKVVTRKSIPLFCLIILIIIIVAIFVAARITVNSYFPVKNMIDLLSGSETEEKSMLLEGEFHNELEYIYSKIGENLHTNKQLSEELNYRIVLLHQSQAYALQTQISPHFLNNVLERINWSAINLIGEKNPISEIIRPLAILFEESLDTKNYLVPVSDEIHHGNVYAYIVSNSYDNDVNLEWNINGDIGSYYVPKLILQPIIENAFIYGISEKENGGKITVEGDFYKDGIRLIVSDDGVGIEKENLKELQDSLAGDNVFERKHIGMRNVNQRIKLLFGNDYGLTITSVVGRGTKVYIYLPKITEADTHNESF